jgi:hypothetical protein
MAKYKFSVGDNATCTYDCFRLVDAPVVVVGNREQFGDVLVNVKLLKDAGRFKAGQTFECYERRLTLVSTKKLTVGEIEKLLGYGMEIVRG